jgi:ABC-2 type transport system ATP-binding protein
MDVVMVERLTKRYGRRVGVEGLNLSVAEGTMFGFLGPNGSGKTTAIRVLLGFLRPSAGEARVFGLDCWRDSARIKAEVGYLPGDLRLYPWLTCRKAMRLFGRVRGRDLTQAGAELSDEFGLDPDVRVRAMSRGMRQKLGLILALAHRPRLLILDEPTASLDPLMQAKLYRRLREFVAEGRTVFLSSHTLGEVERLCGRVVILREGRVVADDTLAALRAKARRVVTIQWRDAAAAPATPPPFLSVLERQDRSWRAALTGSTVELVQWGAGQAIDDLSIEQPDLTALFQAFYG